MFFNKIKEKLDEIKNMKLKFFERLTKFCEKKIKLNKINKITI
jgi:hypothetical protein